MNTIEVLRIKAWLQGAIARKRRVSKTQNPYDQRSRPYLHTAWLTGYCSKAAQRRVENLQ